MDTAVALVGAYLRVNGYVAIPEQPVLIGEGLPWRYHTATDIDLLAVRFSQAAVVVPRYDGISFDGAQDLHLATDPLLDLKDGVVDVIIAEVKEGRPRLNAALREPDVLYATLKRVDPGLDEPVEYAIQRLIDRGDVTCESGGRLWRFRLVAFGVGEPLRDGGPFTVIPLRHAAGFVMRSMAEHRKVWNDAQFGDPVLDLFHLLDKIGLSAARYAVAADGGGSAAAPAEEARRTDERRVAPEPRRD